MTATVNEPAAEVGRSRLRKEDGRLITGRTRWTANITLPGMLHLAILRSPHAHARIARVDVSAALREPNVVAAFSGADVAGRQAPLPCAWPVTEDMVHPDHLPLAVDEVEVHMTTETRDPDEHGKVLAALRAAGYRVESR